MLKKPLLQSPNIDTPTTSPARPTDPRPPTPASTVDSDSPMAALPYAIFSPELTIGPTNNTPPSFVRSFAWGQADVMDPDQSNFLRLREAVLGVHAKASDLSSTVCAQCELISRVGLEDHYSGSAV